MEQFYECIFLSGILSIFLYTIQVTGKINYIVSLQKNEGNGFQHLCAGTIISKNVVLTAAHCFIYDKNPEDLFICGGTDRLLLEKSALRHQVLDIRISEKFVPLRGYDIALVKVFPDFDFSKKRYGMLSFVSKKGLKDKDKGLMPAWNPKNRTIECVPFTVYNTRKCRTKGFYYVTTNEVCVVSFIGRGACKGDSGGPLISSDGKYVVGIMSYGKKACRPKAPYVFTRVKSFESWITRIMHELG